MISAIIVDDVPLARVRIRRLLAAHPDFTVAGEAGSSAEATHLIATARPALIILDIGLPDQNGLAVAAKLAGPAAPLVIFLTAYREHALVSWDVGAVDYLLKPVSEERLAVALDRVRERVAEDGTPRAMKPLLVRERGRTVRISPAQIDYVETADHYLCVRSGERTHLMRGSLTEFARRLEKEGFVRVHRSALIPLRQVSTIHERCNGDADIVLRCGKRLPLSRSFRKEFDRRLREAH